MKPTGYFFIVTTLISATVFPPAVQAYPQTDSFAAQNEQLPTEYNNRGSGRGTGCQRIFSIPIPIC